jgi:hypothetical protein
VSAGANQRRPRCYHRCYHGAKAFGVVTLTRAQAIEIVSLLKDVDQTSTRRSARAPLGTAFPGRQTGRWGPLPSV